MTLRTLTAALAVSATAIAVAAPAAHAAPAPDGAAAQSALLDAFAHHRIVALGQAHELRQQDDFIVALLHHPRFAATVDSIVVEFGNARFQALADRYVAGGDVTLRALRPVWRDQVGAAPDGATDEAPARFFAAVRRLNQTLAPRRRIRVALGDPAFDFRKLHRRDDIDRAGMRRDRVFAATAEGEARGGQHVLLLSGFMHLARLPRELRYDNALVRLERGAPGRVWVIVPYWGGGARGQAQFERRHIAGRPPIQLRPLNGALGAEPADRILPDILPRRPGVAPPADPYPGLELREIGDQLLSVGPCSRLRTTKFSPKQYQEPAYRAELDRRSRILAGRPFTPPPARLSNAPYCPLVRNQEHA